MYKVTMKVGYQDAVFCFDEEDRYGDEPTAMFFMRLAAEGFDKKLSESNRIKLTLEIVKEEEAESAKEDDF